MMPVYVAVFAFATEATGQVTGGAELDLDADVVAVVNGLCPGALKPASKPRPPKS